MWQSVVLLLKEDMAISAVEYAMLLALIGLVTVAAMMQMGDQIATRMNTAATSIQAP